MKKKHHFVLFSSNLNQNDMNDVITENIYWIKKYVSSHEKWKSYLSFNFLFFGMKPFKWSAEKNQHFSEFKFLSSRTWKLVFFLIPGNQKPFLLKVTNHSYETDQYFFLQFPYKLFCLIELYIDKYQNFIVTEKFKIITDVNVTNFWVCL